MRRKIYGSMAVKINATINPLNKAKLELAAKQNGLSVSAMLNVLIDMLEAPVGWDELEQHLIRQSRMETMERTK